MTQRERDARWWRALARDYERRSRRVKLGLDDGTFMCLGICTASSRSDHTLSRRWHNRRLLQMTAMRRTPYGYWWPQVPLSSPDAYDLRATACCLIAAMVEAGDA